MRRNTQRYRDRNIEIRIGIEIDIEIEIERDSKNLGFQVFIFTQNKTVLLPISFLTVGMKMSKGDGNF